MGELYYRLGKRNQTETKLKIPKNQEVGCRQCGKGGRGSLPSPVPADALSLCLALTTTGTNVEAGSSVDARQIDLAF